LGHNISTLREEPPLLLSRKRVGVRGAGDPTPLIPAGLAIFSRERRRRTVYITPR
jgi:hypothetical protein